MQYCSACGQPVTTSIPDGDNRPRAVCPACAAVHYVNPKLVVGCVPEFAGQILLCRRAAAPYAGYWDLAGGFLEVDETPERGLRRELREELGARVQRARFRGFVPDRYGPDGFPVLGIVYEVRVAGRITPGSDVSEVRWVKRDAIPWRRLGFASIRRALLDYLRGGDQKITLR